jgi:uncharacterized protein involved in response to NO
MASAVLPAAAVALADMLFPLALCILVTREVVAAGNRRNYPVAAVLALLALANAGYHFAATGYLAGGERGFLFLLLHTVLLLVTIVGGRVLPNFTANWMRVRNIANPPVNRLLIDRLTIASTALFGLLASARPSGTLTGVSAALVALLQAWRLGQWRGLATLRNPLLFVLHASYAWLPIGYALLALAMLCGIGTGSGALHALAMGGIGSMILSMMTRVPLGHTGRQLQASRLTIVAYLVMIVAVVLRVASSFAGVRYAGLVGLAAIAWGLCFAIYLYVYAPILMAPRLPDRPPS